MGVACLEFRGENFRGWRENREIRENFLPRKFPAIRYIGGAHYVHELKFFVRVLVADTNQF